MLIIKNTFVVNQSKFFYNFVIGPGRSQAASALTFKGCFGLNLCWLLRPYYSYRDWIGCFGHTKATGIGLAASAMSDIVVNNASALMLDVGGVLSDLNSAKHDGDTIYKSALTGAYCFLQSFKRTYPGIPVHVISRVNRPADNHCPLLRGVGGRCQRPPSEASPPERRSGTESRHHNLCWWCLWVCPLHGLSVSQLADWDSLWWKADASRFSTRRMGASAHHCLWRHQRPKTKEHHSEYRKQRNDWSNQGKNIQMYRDANGSGHPTHPIAKTGLPGKGQLQLEHLLRFVGAMLVACNIYDFFFQWHPTVSRALHSAPPTVSDKRKTSIILRKKTDRNPPSRAHQCTNSFCPLAGMWIMEDKLLVEFVASTCVAGAAFGPWYCLWKKSWRYNCLVLQLFGNYSKHRPKTKDQRPAAS